MRSNLRLISPDRCTNVRFFIRQHKMNPKLHQIKESPSVHQLIANKDRRNEVTQFAFDPHPHDPSPTRIRPSSFYIASSSKQSSHRIKNASDTIISRWRRKIVYSEGRCPCAEYVPLHVFVKGHVSLGSVSINTRYHSPCLRVCRTNGRCTFCDDPADSRRTYDHPLISFNIFAVFASVLCQYLKIYIFII